MADRRTYNERLDPLPDDAAVLAAVDWVVEHDRRARLARGASASLVAQRLKISGARRLGRGAQGPQSWTGTMSGALRISPRLQSLTRRGLLHQLDDRTDYRHVYRLTAAGREAMKEAQ